MEYLKSAVEKVAAMSGLGSMVESQEDSPTCQLYEGKMSAKVVLEYIEQPGDTEQNDQAGATNKSISTTSKEQFMRIEILGNDESGSLSSHIEQSGYTHVILAVDRSGSMSGSPLNQVKQALVCLLEETTKQHNVIVDIFTYYQKIVSIKYSENDYKQNINDITAGGRTYFNIVFDKIREMVKNKVNGKVVKKSVVVFMTDGSDTSGEQGKLIAAQKACMEHLKTATQATVVHVVGFSKDHDYKFMNEINHLGKEEGLFRYCEPRDGPEALKDKLAQLFEVITTGGQEFFDVEVEVPSGLRIVTSDGFVTKKQLPLRLQNSVRDTTTDEDGGVTEKVNQAVLEANTWIFVETEEPVPAIKIKVLQSVNGEKIPVQCDDVEVSGHAITKPVDKVEWSLNILERNIDLLTAKIGEAILKKKNLSTLENRLGKLQSKISETKVYDFHVKKEDRRLLLEHVAELQGKLDGLHKMIAEVKRGECDQVSMLARANDLRYQVQFSKTRRHRLMDQRTRVNAEKMKKAQAELDKIVVNREEIESLSSDSLEFFLCTLSQMNVQEIMLDPSDNEDCLGFGLAVKRPEHVLDEPTAVRIWAVSGTLVSRGSMMDALTYKIDVGGHLVTHGGFNIDAVLGVATVGLSREPINAWLPMYICESHWQRVKILLKPTLGYFCTLDPLGYNYKQLDVLFQVLGSMISQLEPTNCSEHQLKMIFAFQRLCVAVMKDFELINPITETVQNFLAGPAGRTKDVVPNLFVLFGYIVCLPKDKLENLFGADSKERSASLNGLWVCILSESLRRAARTVYREASDAQTDGILNTLISAGMCNSEESKPPLSNANLLQIWRTSSQMKEIEIPAYSVETGINLDEVAKPQPNSEKVDKAMEVWAQAKCGVIRNKNQEENVKKASSIVTKWVDDGHEIMDDAVKSDKTKRVDQLGESEQGASKQIEQGKPKIQAEWTKDSMKNLMSMLQVVKKLGRGMYPRIGHLTGYMAYVSFWLKHLPDFTEMDQNSGMPPNDWITSAKAAVTALCGRIRENSKTMAADKTKVPKEVQVVVTEQAVMPEKEAAASQEEDYDYDSYDEYEEESAQEQLQKKFREATKREPNVCEVLSVVHHGKSVHLLCAMLVQAMKFNRNSAARAAATDGNMQDLKNSENIQATLECVKKTFKEKEHAAILDEIEKVFWQRSNFTMFQAPTIWSFIGYLMNTYKDRGEGLSEFLRIVTSQENTVKMPLIADKVKIIMMGKYKDHVVLSNGNIWMPEKKVGKKFAAALGQEIWEAIEVEVLSHVAIHVYRESDIPNRHKHCNSNPYIPNALRQKLGMELLPEKLQPKSSKIKKKYTK